MNPSSNQNLYVCGCCKRELPLEEFYMTRRTVRDGYCKACRCQASQRGYSTKRRCNNKRRRNYPVITDIADREVRLELLRNALQTVSQSMERKSRKRWELE